MSLTIGSLFSGIGGLELGLERAGLGPVLWQVEQNAYCRAVLAKHWPDATRYEDVRNVGRANLVPVDVICGGFPCQPHSQAGRHLGVDDERYLWPEFVRVVREMGPRRVVVENVADLLADGTALRVLGDLADCGYDAEWSVVSACSVGASHTRERLFIVAHANAQPGPEGVRDECRQRGMERPLQPRDGETLLGTRSSIWLEDPSALYRDADGVPDRVLRNGALGNAVVPAVAEVVGRVVMELEAQRISECVA